MKNRKLNYLRTAGMVWILGGLVIYLMYCGYGCASPRFHKVVTLENVTVHIVSDRSQFDNQHARISRNVNGYARRNGEIWVLGHQTRHGVTVDKQRTLGHELLHLLHWKDMKIANPDEK